MNQYYGKGPDDERHESPTRRLISQKNTCFDHKKLMAGGGIERTQDYGITYCSSPGRSYVIEPHGGELNYKLAQKDTLKFYDQVFNQDITKHKLKEGGSNKHGSDKKVNEEEVKKLHRKVKVEITSVVTKRPYLKIMEKIRNKIAVLLQSKIGFEFSKDIIVALKDK